MYFEFLLEQGVQLAESSLRMCTDHEEITPESLLASKKKNERRKERKEGFWAQFAKRFLLPRHCTHGDEKAGKTHGAKPAEATGVSSLSNSETEQSSW